jgi:hypothetical protein
MPAEITMNPFDQQGRSLLVAIADSGSTLSVTDPAAAQPGAQRGYVLGPTQR